jgi:hypothetical protein
MTQNLIIKVCAGIIAISGLVIITSTVYPILSYEWEASQKYPMLISSLVDEKTGDFKFVSSDSTKLSSWFNDKRPNDFISQKVSFLHFQFPNLRSIMLQLRLEPKICLNTLFFTPEQRFPEKPATLLCSGIRSCLNILIRPTIHQFFPRFMNLKTEMKYSRITTE